MYQRMSQVEVQTKNILLALLAALFVLYPHSQNIGTSTSPVIAKVS